MATHIDHLRGLYKDCGLMKEDIFTKNFKGGKAMTLITRTGIEKIQAQKGITYDIEVISCTSTYCAIKLTAKMGDEVCVTLASASKENASIAYYPELAEKRGIARAVIKLTKAAEHGLYSTDEISGMEEEKKTKETIKAPKLQTAK
jgi:hypothetical protein